MDWWAVGAVAYEMFVGLPPFNADTLEDILDAILHADVPFVAEVFDADPDLWRLVTSLMDKDPEARIQVTRSPFPAAFRALPTVACSQ